MHLLLHKSDPSFLSILSSRSRKRGKGEGILGKGLRPEGRKEGQTEAEGEKKEGEAGSGIGDR